MDAWTLFGLVKLFLSVVEGGPSAAVKGVLLMAVPGSEVLDVAETLHDLFGLDGSYQGQVSVTEDSFVPLSGLTLVNERETTTALAKLNFPELQRRQFSSRSFPVFGEMRFPQLPRKEEDEP